MKTIYLTSNYNVQDGDEDKLNAVHHRLMALARLFIYWNFNVIYPCALGIDETSVEQEYEELKGNGIEMITMCDILYVLYVSLDGTGADEEMEFATQHNIVQYESLSALYDAEGISTDSNGVLTATSDKIEYEVGYHTLGMECIDNMYTPRLYIAY